MSSRMSKYEFEEKKTTPSRTKKNAELYQKEDLKDYNKIDVNSNVSILKNDVKQIDVDNIREILDKKYRDNIPRRKSINIEAPEEPEPPIKEVTKEYDINDILAKAKSDKEVDYHEDRLRNLRDTNYKILDNLDLNTDGEDGDEADDDDEITSEKKLKELINTIAQLEKTQKTATDLLELTDDTDPNILPANEEKTMENSFYTGSLEVKDNDYDDFAEIKKEMNSSGIFIKVLIAIFVIILIAVIVFVLNNQFEWGLF